MGSHLVMTSCIIFAATMIVGIASQECDVSDKTRCDINTTLCVPTNSSFYCKCRLDKLKDCQLRPDYRILDPDVYPCCSHITSNGAWLVEVHTAEDGELAAVEHVACIHLMKNRIPSYTEHSIPIETQSDEVRNIQLTLAAYYRDKNPHDTARFSIKEGACYKEVVFGDYSTRSSDSSTAMYYFAAEKGHLYRDGDTCRVIPRGTSADDMIGLSALNHTIDVDSATNTTKPRLSTTCRSSAPAVLSSFLSFVLAFIAITPILCCK